ncbi:MAG: MBL fold metallo-hydrolase [Planctomycetota bacterium]
MDRRSFLALTALATAGAVHPAVAHFARHARRADDLNLPWEMIADGVYVTPPSVNGGNVVLAIGDDKAVVVDSKFAYLGRAIFLDAVRVGKSRPVVLVNTHHHGDHTGGNAGFDGAEAIWGHGAIAKRIEEQVPRYVQQAQGGPREITRAMPDDERLIDLAGETAQTSATWSAGDFGPSKTIRGGGAQIDAGGVKVNLRHRGTGHTDNDLIVKIAGRNVLHTGDLVFNGFHPFFDANGGVDPRGWIKSLGACLGMCDGDTVVVPGHGPHGGRELIEAQIEYHERLIAAVSKEIDAGTSREDAKAMRFDFFGDRGFQQLAPIAIDVVYGMLLSERGEG